MAVLSVMFCLAALGLLAEPVAAIAIKFTKMDYFLLALFGLVTVGSVSTKNYAKGLVGVLRLVQSDSGTAEDILNKAQTEGSYIDLSLQWLYSTDYITTLTPCEGVTTGTYYLAWVGRSNNSRPLIRSITAI